MTSEELKPEQIRIGCKVVFKTNLEWSHDWPGEHEVTGIYLRERHGESKWFIDTRHNQDGAIYDGPLESVEHVVDTCAPVSAGVPEGWKLVQSDRSYDQRTKAIIAFNQAEKAGKDRDDALQAAWDAMLAASPSALPDTGAGEPTTNPQQISSSQAVQS